MLCLTFSLLLSPLDVENLKELCEYFARNSMDDDRFHDINREIYACDAVLTFPLSVNRYKLVGMNAFAFFPSWELTRCSGQRQMNLVSVT